MGGAPQPLPGWDRKVGKLVSEFLDEQPDTYDTRPRRSATAWLESQPLYDWLVAFYQNTRWSARRIEPFINKHKIDMSEFRPTIYRSFADFFDREFKPGQRSFPELSSDMGAFAEARYFAWERLEKDQRFPIKERSLSAEQILGAPNRGTPFVGGPVILARLAPVDYHHVHYPDHGQTVEHDRQGHRLWTVNWRALLHQEDILLRNERQINLLNTDNFGRLGFVEIGAMSVGRIVQVHPYDRPYERGAEKAVF